MAVAGGGQPPFLSPQSVPNSLKRRQISKRKKEKIDNKTRLWSYKLFVVLLASLKSMLNLNSPMSKTTVPSEPVWKVSQ